MVIDYRLLVIEFRLMPMACLGIFMGHSSCPKTSFQAQTRTSATFFIGRISLKIMYLAKERESDDSLLGGAYETRTRDPLRDRQIF